MFSRSFQRNIRLNAIWMEHVEVIQEWQSLLFCIRDDRGDLIFAKAKGIVKITNMELEPLAIREAKAKSIGEITNVEAEDLAIREALAYCQAQHLMEVTVVIASLTIKRMIENQ